MEPRYVYCKVREEFGKQCVFESDGPIAIENVEPDPELRREFISKEPCHIASQTSQQYAIHEVQTECEEKLIDRGMFHYEGGWPKEVNCTDEEATSRFRKRVERSEDWALAIKNLAKPMERCVKQNNAIDIYENYFDDMIPTSLVLPLAARVVNIYANPQLDGRPVTNISWSGHGRRMIVSHCSMDFQRPTSPRLSPVSYLWLIENPTHPMLVLRPKSPCVAIEFNPRHSSLLISGHMTGQVASWDLRAAESPIAVSDSLSSHSDPASIALWIDTKTHCEFASASTDGLIKWWDIRKIREPTETLAMDLGHREEGKLIPPIGISALNFSGNKFMVGLENGIVINASPKAASNAEKLASRFKCHVGPVISVKRNPFIPKIFLTVGDWKSRIWSEDTRENCLTSTEYRMKNDVPTAGCWSTSRVSVFYVIGSSGEMEVWDLLSGVDKPVETLKLSKGSLSRIRVQENGKLTAVGDQMGDVYLVEFSEALTTSRKNDKALLTSYLENCSRYEKLIDVRLREMRNTQRLKYQDFQAMPEGKDKVKQKTNKTTGKKVEKATSVPLDSDLIETEKAYFTLIKEELKKYGKVFPEVKVHEKKAHEHLELKPKDRKHVKHHRKSYKRKESKKYERLSEDTETESSLVDTELSLVSEVSREVMKPAFPSPKRIKNRERSPKPCAAQIPSVICRPAICCGDLKNSFNKRNKLPAREEALPNKSLVSRTRNEESLPKRTNLWSPGIGEPNERAHLPLARNPIPKVKGLICNSFKETQITKNSAARPSMILLEATLAKKRMEREVERIKLHKTKVDMKDSEEAKVEKPVVQDTGGLRERISSEDAVLQKVEDVETRLSPILLGVQGAKMNQQKSSPKDTKTFGLPRRALTALQVIQTEAFKPLPKLTVPTQLTFPEKDNYVHRMYPGSSAFPPLPRILLPKLVDRPPDPPVVVPEKGEKGKKVKRKAKSGKNKADASRSPEH